LLRLHVQPRASKTKLVGLHGDRLKIAVASPPVDGKANKEIVNYLAKSLGIPQKGLVLKSGEQSRQKVIAILVLDEGEVRSAIEQYIE